MTAHVFSAGDWLRARAARAQAGKAPRLSVTRTIALREHPAGIWSAIIYERRYGVWKKPERLCAPLPYEDAHAVALAAWRQYRLPLSRVVNGDNRFQPFHLERADTLASVPW
jgi:hypothetical protein